MVRTKILEFLQRASERSVLLARVALAALTVALLGLAHSAGAVPMLLGYQGAVFDDTGAPAQGPIEVGAALYSVPTSGVSLYEETHSAVPLVEGVFDIEIGAGDSPIGTLDETTFATSELWLELRIDGETLQPRQRLLSVPFAVRSAQADTATTALGVSFPPTGGWSGTVLSANTNETGTPDGDGLRIRSEDGYFADGGDAAVFEKTDGNHPDPDGGIAFANTGPDGVVETALVIRGDGDVGIGTESPATTLHVVGDGSTVARAAIRAENFNPDRGMASYFANDSNFATSHFENAGSGQTLWVVGNGQTHFNAAVRAMNLNPVQGMAGFFSNNSNYATVHLQNDGTGETLWLDNGGQGDFIRAYDATRGRHQFWVDDQGVTNVRTLRIHGGADLSESFDVRHPQGLAIEPGSVVAIDPDDPGKLVVSGEAYDRAVAGIVAGAGDLAPGLLLRHEGTAADGGHPVALSGRVYALADASNGPIRPGDLLTTSARSGHAMRATDASRAQGAVLGKAMGPLEEGTGLLLVLVGLQ